jgi:hypothetical protein
MPRRRGWGILWRGWLQRFRSWRNCGVGARLCPQDQSQRVNGGEVLENFDVIGCFDVRRLIPLRGTQPRSNRNAVAAFSPALARSGYAG